MKININFDWAVLTSIFTIFLYWCGYCYYIGYLSFYHHNLDAFDIPLASTVIQGMLTGYKAWCPLVAILIIFSYVSSISKKQWLYWIVRSIGLTVNLLIVIYSLSLHYLIAYLRKLDIRVKTKKFIMKNTPSLLKVIWHNIAQFFIKLGKLIYKKDKEIEVTTTSLLTKFNLTQPQIKKSIFEDDQSKSTSQNFDFDFSFFVHYSILLVLLLAMIKGLQVGQELIDRGKDVAKERFTLTKSYVGRDRPDSKLNIYPQVEIDGVTTEEKLFLTTMCLKSLCLVTDQNKNAKIYEAKQIKLMNQQVKN
ncbi:hypothetical protein [Acinetobacter haemolyticus]|uniref:hypothetical protein n=1 Tax=Acinetobacter haemolyticus TaxID=29430 RepID=UPI003F578C74